MPSGHRDRVLLRFRDTAADEIGLLSNARCLGEGVDVPSLDGIAFIDPRRSTIDIVQALGRAIRKSPRKKLGTIVLPVFLSDDDDLDCVLDDSAFKHVWDVLKALRAHDEALGEELDELRRRVGARHTAPRRPGKIKLDVPAGRVGADFIRALNLRVVEQTTASWEFYLGLLETFVEREGHARVPAQRREEGYRVGGWVAVQRQAYRDGTLDPERRARLEALPRWAWEPHLADWEEGFAHLQKFVEREEHARVPAQWREDGYRLGVWVGGQRGAYLGGTLDPERRARLEALRGWVWDALQADWEEGFAYLQKFVEREEHARVPAQWREDGYRLGVWVGGQRGAYLGGTLDPERRARLEALRGWVWDALQADWEDGFAYLQKFVEREEHARVPKQWRENGFPLGQWVDVQRGVYQGKRHGTLDPERRARLEALPRPGSPTGQTGRRGSPTCRSSLSATSTRGSRRGIARTASASAAGSLFNVRRTAADSSTRSVALDWRRCQDGPGSPTRQTGRRASPI